ncbi:MAG: GNAT family N-acetyltransferase [Thermoanaerobaculia bacterium]
MKGQRLFVRPATAADRPRLAAFFAAEERPLTADELASDALIGFLVGDLAARIAFTFDPAEFHVTDVWVARKLRRKRVARVMFAELAELAGRLGSGRIACRKHPLLDEPLRRLGFADEGEAWTLPVERS